jgi:hypothetical protein
MAGPQTPDPGLASRLAVLADAAAHERDVWVHARSAGLRRRAVARAGRAHTPHELRPGAARAGPPALWERFDAAVAGLNLVIAGSDAAVVADAFGDLSEAARGLADAIRTDPPPAASLRRL